MSQSGDTSLERGTDMKELRLREYGTRAILADIPAKDLNKWCDQAGYLPHSKTARGYIVIKCTTPPSQPLPVQQQQARDGALIDAMRVELRRRLADRNTKGYWGVNARAWAHKLVRDIRKLEGE